jgi:hypothetical protein
MTYYPAERSVWVSMDPFVLFLAIILISVFLFDGDDGGTFQREIVL